MVAKVTAIREAYLRAKARAGQEFAQFRPSVSLTARDKAAKRGNAKAEFAKELSAGLHA